MGSLYKKVSEIVVYVLQTIHIKNGYERFIVELLVALESLPKLQRESVLYSEQ
jgi:hypothetical protein